MKRYISLFVFISFFTIATFVIFEQAGITFEGVLNNHSSKLIAAFVSVLLLGIDVILPIPSSVIMVSNGVLFGFVLGGFLSVVGGLLSSVVGYLIGAKSKRWAAKLLGGRDDEKAEQFLEKYGYIAIIVSRPIPILAESVSILSGTSGLDFKRVVVNSIIGLVPISFIYSLTGAYSTSLDSAVYAFLLNIGIAGLIWFITRPRKKD